MDGASCEEARMLALSEGSNVVMIVSKCCFCLSFVVSFVVRDVVIVTVGWCLAWSHSKQRHFVLIRAGLAARR